MVERGWAGERVADDDDRVEIVWETYQWYPVCLPIETFLFSLSTVRKTG